MLYQQDEIKSFPGKMGKERCSESVSESAEPKEEFRKEELLSVLEQCGHRIHHRKGGRHGQKRILRILDHNSPMTQRELQERLQIQAGSMSEIIAKLENSGLVEKTRDGQDKRKAVLVITEMGHKTVAEQREADAASNRRLLDNFTVEECTELMRLIRKLLVCLKDEEEMGSAGDKS